MKLNFNSKLVIFISCFLSIISGNAQTTCIDPDLPVLNTTATVVCPGTSVNLAIASGALNDATDWYWYSNSCGGSPVGTGLSLSVNPTTTTTYYVRGEGGCVTPGACTGQTIVVLPPVTLSLKVFIQGYYLGNGQMTPSIYYSLGSPYQPTDVDLITVELRDVATCIVVGSYEVVLQTDGTVQVPVDCAVSGGTYYIVVKHRSSIETWSSSPVIFNGSVSYDFSAQQSNAYCDNEIDVMTEGIYSMYSGDFNQDGLINECDRTLLENDIANAVFGYFSTDLNGDGFVDAFDLLLFDQILPLNIAMCSPCGNAQAIVVCPIIGPKTICGDGSGGIATYYIAPVAGATQYNWTVPNGMTILGGQGSSSVTVSWTGVAAQMGILGVICVSVPTPCGIAECCDSIKIGVAPEVNLGPDIVLCNPGDCVVLASTPINNVNNYSWYTLPGFVSIPQTNSSLLVCPTAPTCYALIVENLTGCRDTDTVCVSFYNPPLVSWSGLLPEQCGGDAPYSLSGGIPAGGFYSGDGVSGNLFNPGVAGVGVHMLSYTYSDSCGHVTTISKAINVINCPCKEPFCRDFNDNDLHGWTVNPSAPMVDVQITSLNSQNGPADYYLLASDLTGPSLLKAEIDFNGRWCCGEFCFDYRTFDDGDPNSVLDIHPVFYLVRGDKTFRFTSSVSVTETNGWQHVCAPITNCNPPPVSSEGVWEALPGTSNTDWDPLTNHIDSIFFQIDWNGGDEIAGFDNVCFNARNLSATIAAVDCNTLCATVSGCCGPFSYIWTVPPGVVITSGSGNSCIQGNLISGDYTVIVSNTTGEVSTTTYHLDFPPAASWSQTTVELCTSDSPYALSGAEPQSGAGGSGVYSGGTFITGTAPNQYFDPSLVSPGTYFVSYTFTDTCGNTSTVSVDFVVTDCACDIFGSDYSSASGWTQIGTSINIDATVIDKVSFLNVPGSSDHRVYRNIGLLGNTWTAEFDFNPMSGSNVGVASELLCLTAGNLIPFRETPLGNFTVQDFISAGVTSPFNTPNYLVSTQITASYKDDATTPVIAGSIDIPSWNTDFFVRLERFDATSGLLSVFSDAARTIHIPGSPVCLLFPSTVQGLNTLQHTNVNQAGAGRRFTGTVDNTCIRSTRTTAELTASVLSIDDYDCHHAGCIHLDIPPTAAFTISYYYEDPLNSNNNYASPVSNTTSILCNLPAGDYTIYLTDACGTNITLTATIQNLNPLAVSAGPDLTICQGACVNLSATPIVPGVTYAWYRLPDRSLLSSSPFLSDCPPVDFCYLLIATGSTGCMDSDSVCVNVELMQLTCSGTNVTCHGGTNGSVCATASCLNPPYSINWTKNGTPIQGAQTLCLNGLTAGTYCITITPSSGAVETCCYTVTEPAQLSIDAIAFDAPTCGGLGSFSFFPSGGTPPYIITTDTCIPAAQPCIYNTSVGFSTTQVFPAHRYKIYITDANGCKDSIERIINEPLPPQISVSKVNPLCCGGFGHINVDINGGRAPFQIILSTYNAVDTTFFHAYMGYTGNYFTSPDEIPAGSYIVEVLDANNCRSSVTIEIVDPPCLELHVSTTGFNGIECDGHISAYATGGTPFNTNAPVFHVPHDIIITQISGNSPGITFSQSGTLNSSPFYNFADQCCNGVYVITATDSNGCTVTDTLRMNCNFKLSPMAGVPSTLCIRNTEDAQVGELSPNANYGSSISLRVSRWTYNLNWATVRTYLKFNINNIPQNSISSATLSLSTCPDCTPFDVHKDLSSGNPWFANPPWGNASIISGVSGAWSENSITWNNAPAPNAITDAGASLGDQTTSSLNVNVTNIVQDWITSGVNNGMMIRLADDPAFPINYYHEVNFASRENLDTNIHPRLCISYYEPTVTICSGSSVPLAAQLIAGVDYKWYTVPGYALAGSGNVLSVSPLTNQLYAVIAITPSGCRDTNFVQVNVVTNVDDGDDCTSDYCLNGIVYHTRIISCTCPCTAPSTLSPNIVVNGNFSNGNTGFTSDLPYINACATNSYSVGNTARTKCANFNLIPDHTTGSGTGNDNFLIVDGRDAGTYTVWNGAVGNIVNGKTYTFSFALYPNVSNSTSLPNSIDVVLGNTVILSIPRSNLINNSWNEFCTSFTATANIQAARLKISHTISGGGLGYDYGIDDIIFKKCRTRIILDDVSISNVTCYGGYNGSITVTPTGGTSPYTYLWSNSATTATISNLSPGTYSVTVTDATGDVSTTSLDVLEADPVISTLSVTNPIQCYGGTTCIQVVGSGGTPPYSVTGTFCGYPEGTWTFTIYDSNGCDATSNVTIHQPSKLENSMSGVGANCGLANGSATAAPSGGTPPYSYQWNTVPGQSGATAVNLLPGTYTVTVTDANGCSRTDQITIGNSGGVPASPGAISGPAGVCRNQVNQVFCVPPVPGATSYLWTLPGGLTGTSTSNCITLSTSNTYTGGFICVRAINSCGISLATCMNLPVLTVKPPVPSSIIGNTTICGPGTYTFSTSVVANATVYNWSVTGSGVSIASGQGTNSITVSVPAGFGQGTVSVNAGNCVGNSGSRGIFITGVPSNSLPINGPTVVCAGINNVSYTFGTVTGATSYVWSSNTPNMTVISQSGISCVVNFGPGFTTGNLSVNAISSCGSYARTVIIKSVPSQPGGITGPYVNLCGAQTVSYSIAAVASATSYVWTSPAGTTILSGQGTTGISVSIPAAFAGGTVCVQAVNACGASIARCLTISALPSPPTGITGPINVCKSSSQNYSITPIAGASSYNWSITGGAGVVSSGTSATVNFATAVSGTAILKVKGNNACGSSSPAQLSIVVNLGCRSSQTSELQNAGFEVYPNPNNGAFTLSFNAEKASAYNLKVFDILGNAVYNDQIQAVIGENTVDIDLGKTAQGMYQLSIQNDEGETRTLRLVIE